MGIVLGDASPQRLRLAEALRRLRARAGLSTTELARRTHMSQSKVSRLELGRSRPAVPDVVRWADATGATAEERATLTAWAEALATEVSPWRHAERHGLARLQDDVGRLEAASTTIRTFQPILIPGLLQTAEYARRVFEAGHPDGHPEIAEAVAARVRRQSVLYDRSKHIELLTIEQALRWRTGAPMLDQLDRIQNVAGLSNVRLGIIPQETVCAAWYYGGFNLYEGKEPVVVIETLTSMVLVTAPEEVEAYRRAFLQLFECALTGREATALAQRILEELRSEA